MPQLTNRQYFDWLSAKIEPRQGIKCPVCGKIPNSRYRVSENGKYRYKHVKMKKGHHVETIYHEADH